MSKGEVLVMNIELVIGLGFDSIPMSLFHSFVRHKLEQRTTFGEIGNSLGEIVKRLPFLESLWKFSPSILEVQQLSVNSFSININQQKIVVTVDRIHDSVVEALELLKEAKLLFDDVNGPVLGLVETKELQSCRCRIAGKSCRTWTGTRQVAQKHEEKMKVVRERKNSKREEHRKLDPLLI